MTDYNKYQMSKKEMVQYGCVGGIGSYILLYLFFKSLLFGCVCFPFGAAAFCLYEKKQLAKKRRWQLMVEFKDAMDGFVSALAAGYSLENAVSETYEDLHMMYGKETIMTKELKDIQQKISLRQPLDGLLLDLGRRSGVEDIITFAQIYATARRSGGNLIQVMKRTAENIGEKMEIQREIQTMIAGKKMEATLMTAIPLLIIVYMQIFSPGFLDPLYESVMGRIVMSGALLIYGTAVLWSRKIMACDS